VNLAASSFAANAASVSGSVSPALSNGKVYLYIDGALADSATGVSGNFSIPVNTTAFNRLYSGSTIALTSKSAGGAEKLDCTFGCTAGITCSALPSPGFTLTPTSIYVNDTTVGSVTNAASGMLYTLIASPDNGTSYGRSVMSSSSTVTLPSYTFSTVGSYPVAVQVVNLAEGSTCVSSTTPSTLSVSAVTPLALEFIRIWGHAEETVNRLDWQAESDRGTLGYNVERSSDGASYSLLGTVRAEGTGVYSYSDNTPPAGTSYYRLRINAGSGHATYSHVVTIRRRASNESLTASPVPVGTTLTLTNSNPSRNGQEAVVLDIYGRVIHTFTLQSSQVLDARTWPAGAYVVRLCDGESVRLVKQ
jgi:hypothetical protein